MKRKSLVYLGLLLTLTMTACGSKEETAETVVETIVETTEGEETVGLEPVTETIVEEVGEPITPYGELNGFEYSKETSFNLPWAFTFTNQEHNAPQDYPGMSVEKQDAITEFKSVKYKDEGDLRVVEVEIENSTSYNILHEFGGGDFSFTYVYSYTHLHPLDLYTGNLYAYENTSDEKNYYDTTTTLDLGNKKVDVRVEKVEESEIQKGDWKLYDDNTEFKKYDARKTYTYKFTYPKDYDGVVFYLVKNGAEEVFLEYQEEVIGEPAPILTNYTVDELIFVRLNDLIDTIGEEAEEIVDVAAKAEEIRVKEEEAAKAKAQEEAEAEKQAEMAEPETMTPEEFKALCEQYGIAY